MYDSTPEQDHSTEGEYTESPAVIRAALDQMLAGESFGRSERPGRFLRHLVETALADRSHLLKESVIGCDVFGRPASWDPRVDPIVRQEASRLRKRIARYYETEGTSSPVRIVLPVGSYVPLFRNSVPEIPLPNTAPVAAAITPPYSGPVSAPNRKLSWPVLIGILVCAFLAFLAWRAVHRETAIAIAVLPFRNPTGDPADQYFSDGVTGEVTDSVSRLKSVHVVSPATVLKLGRQARDLRQVAGKLRASYLVDGAIERSGDLVTVVASLVRGSDGAKLWTNTYRRYGADVSAIEADLTANVAASLGIAAVSLDAQTHRPPSEAHDLYLRGKFESSRTTVEANGRAQEDFRRALQLDPAYVLAYSGLAQAIWNENIWAGTSPDITERRKAEELWQKALELDPGSLSAHSGLAAYAMQYDWDWKRAERELQAAISAGDNAGVEETYAYLCLILGRRAESDRHMNRAIALDPESSGVLSNLVNLLLLEGRFEEARRECEKWIERDRNSVGPKLTLDGILADQGKTTVALRNLSALPQDRPRVQMVLAQVRARAGDRQGALRILGQLEQNNRDGRMFLYDFAVVYADLGDTAAAARCMEKSLDAREGPAIYIRVDPEFAKLQNTPEFHALKRRVNLDW